MNLSAFSDASTATTREECARQRVENLCALGARSSLELCVGPSLRTIAELGAKAGLHVAGNDIDPRWREFYPRGSWIIGDALAIDYDGYDAVVFAPPLSRGCSGKREDALRIDDVEPRYTAFLDRVAREDRLLVMTLPGRSWSTRQDRAKFHCIVRRCETTGRRVHAVALTIRPKKLVKYVDIYMEKLL